jgi:hypothetical protein
MNSDIAAPSQSARIAQLFLVLHAALAAWVGISTLITTHTSLLNSPFAEYNFAVALLTVVATIASRRYGRAWLYIAILVCADTVFCGFLLLLALGLAHDGLVPNEPLPASVIQQLAQEILPLGIRVVTGTAIFLLSIVQLFMMFAVYHFARSSNKKKR